MDATLSTRTSSLCVTSSSRDAVVASRGRSSPVSRYGARTFTWKVRSKPSVVTCRSGSKTPALLSRRWSRGWLSSTSRASARTSSRESKSRTYDPTTPPSPNLSRKARDSLTRSTALRTFDSFRPWTMTPYPAAHSMHAVCSPMPSVAPVTSAMRRVSRSSEPASDVTNDLHETDFTSTVSCLCPRLLAPLATFGDAPRPVTSECSPVEIDDDAMVSIASVCRPRGPDSGPGGEDI